MVWGHQGRAHPEVARAMRYCATLITRRSGAPFQKVMKRWAGEIGTILAVRRARMARRILPKLTPKEQFLDGTQDEVQESRGFNSYVEEAERPEEEEGEAEKCSKNTGQEPGGGSSGGARPTPLQEFWAAAFQQALAANQSRKAEASARPPGTRMKAAQGTQRQKQAEARSRIVEAKRAAEPGGQGANGWERAAPAGA